MSTPMAQLISKTVSGFFAYGEVKNEVCKIARRCAPSGGSGSVTTGDSDTIEFTGNGSPGSPLTASVVLSEIPVPTLDQVLTAGNTSDNAIRLFPVNPATVGPITLDGEGLRLFNADGVGSFILGGDPLNPNTAGTTLAIASYGPSQFHSTGAIDMRTTQASQAINLSATGELITFSTSNTTIATDNTIFLRAPDFVGITHLTTTAGLDPEALLHVFDPGDALSGPIAIFEGEVRGLPAANSNEFVTLGQIDARRLTATSVLDFPDTPGGDNSDLTVTVTGAAEGDPVAIGIPVAAILDESTYLSWVSAPNTVTIRFINFSLSSQNPPSATFKVVVSKF